jgi:hypothetical protein
MVLRDPALAARARSVSWILNVGPPLFAVVVLVTGSNMLLPLLGAVAAIDVAYYVWVARNNV